MPPGYDKSVTSATLRNALVKRYPGTDYAVMFEVNEGTGANLGRRADAIVQSMWPSRGLELMGFELKVSRSDLRAELEDPSKCDAIARFCDSWWLVTPKGLVTNQKLLPKPWGLLEYDSERDLLVPTIRAPTLERTPATRMFLAALMRARTKQDTKERSEQVKRDAEKLHAEALRLAKQMVDCGAVGVDQQQIERTAEGWRKLEAIKAATGIDLAGYTSATDFIKAIRLARSSSWHHGIEAFGRLLNDEGLRSTVNAVLNATKKGNS